MIRVLLVDDQELIRQALRKLLQVEDDIEVAGEAGDGLEALAVLAARPVDVALVDARMPRMDGVELVTRMAAEHPGVAVLVLSTFDEDEYIFGALRAGARGYLLKDASPDELVTAIRKVASGQTVLGDVVAARLVAELRSRPSRLVRVPDAAELPGRDVLSPRELEVARLLAVGASNREIADRLSLSEGTVKNHVSSMLRKLGLPDRTRLALYFSSGSRPD